MIIVEQDRLKERDKNRVLYYYIQKHQCHTPYVLGFGQLCRTGILGSWILRKIIQNHQIKKHFEQSPAHLDFKAGKLYSKCKSFSRVPYLPV